MSQIPQYNQSKQSQNSPSRRIVFTRKLMTKNGLSENTGTIPRQSL